MVHAHSPVERNTTCSVLGKVSLSGPSSKNTTVAVVTESIVYIADDVFIIAVTVCVCVCVCDNQAVLPMLVLPSKSIC